MKLGADLRALGLHRGHQRIDHPGLGRELAEHFAHLRELGDAVDVGDAMSEAGQEFELHAQANHRLVILIHVAWRAVELLLAHLDLAFDEDPVPRHLHVVEIENRVVLVEAARQRVVEHCARGVLA